MSYRCIYFLVLFESVVGGQLNSLVWSGGPIHLECEHSLELFTNTGQYVRENIIAIKAVTYKDNIYVITPRMKRGVLATVWLLVRGRKGIELQPYPDVQAHHVGDCRAIQNAVDFYIDHLGNLWILDSGIVDSLESPRCTCSPKVVMINTRAAKITKSIDLSSLTEPTSMLQNVVVEYGIGGKAFVYVSDASRGAVLVNDVATGSVWSVIACAPATGLQLALVRRSATHAVLILVRIQFPGLLELDTAALRRQNSLSPLRVLGDHSKPVLLLGADFHHVYLRHTECSDVLSWDVREAYNSSLISIHSPGPHLTPTSVSTDPLKHILLVLDSNYGETVHGNTPTYHRITFIGHSV